MKRSQIESMVRKVVKEELPQLNKGSQPTMANAKVKSPKMEKLRYVAQTFQSLMMDISKLEQEGDESSAAQSLEGVKKLIKSAQVKFLKEYVSLYK